MKFREGNKRSITVHRCQDSGKVDLCRDMTRADFLNDQVYLSADKQHKNTMVGQISVFRKLTDKKGQTTGYVQNVVKFTADKKAMLKNPKTFVKKIRQEILKGHAK